MNNLKNSGNEDLAQKLLYLLLFIMFYRFCSYVPIPGVNTNLVAEVAKSYSGGFLSVLNVFTGGSLGRMSILALNIMPYITASIVMQLLTIVSPNLEELKKKGGEIGRKKILLYTKYLTILLALIQGYGIASTINSMVVKDVHVVFNSGLNFKIFTSMILTGGTFFVIWLSDCINAKAIGNGSSVIIFSGIVAGLPSSISQIFQMGKMDALPALSIFIFIFSVCGIIALIVFVERLYRKVAVHYPKRQVGNKIYEGENSYLPLKINTAGVVPPIFTNSVLLFPGVILGIINIDQETKQRVLHYIGHGTFLYMTLYILLIVFFSFFYTSIIFNPTETAENLKKNGAIILGQKPGKNTAVYINNILKKLNIIGASYLSLVCIVPELLMSKYSIPFYLGGTSLLIAINVIMDFMTQIQSHMLGNKYKVLLSKHKLVKI